MSRNQSAALPVAYVTLRILIILNWLYAACLLALLSYSFINEPFLMRALQLASPAENPELVMGVRAIAGLGILCGSDQSRDAQTDDVDGRHGSRRRSVRRRQCLSAEHDRLALLALQLIGLVIGGIGKAVSTPAHPLHLDAGFSPSGWLAVILTFVLARVFAEGALMRDDLEGTV